MPDLGPITRKLAALASGQAVFRSGLRVLTNGINPPALPAILDEVDATMLRRQLTLQAGDSRIVLLVAGRRILEVVAVSDDLAAVGRALIGQSLSQDDPEGLEALGVVLSDFAAEPRAILVDSAPAAAGKGGTVGVSVARLTDLLELDETPLRPVQLFIETCEPLYTACLYRSGGVWIGHADDPALLDRLRGMAEAQADRLRQCCQAPDESGDTPHLVVLERALTGDLSISATWVEDDFAIIAHADPDTGRIHAAWRRIFTV